MLELIKQRHSVRQYTDKKIEQEKREVLNKLISKINEQTGLSIQVCYDEPEAFSTFLAHYGKFDGVTNYVALIGTKGQDEIIGYQGEKIVLKAQELGLNTCWVGLTYGKGKAKVNKAKGEKIYCVLALGYGKNLGVSHKIKSATQVSNVSDQTPDWFKLGAECALLAPTAMNQQKFKFIYKGGKVMAKSGVGFYSKVDLGIAKYHFEIGANQPIEWE